MKNRFFWKVVLVYRALKGFSVFIFVLDILNLFQKEKIILKTRNNLKVFSRTRSSDRNEIAIIFSDNEYPKVNFPDKQCPVILDIGAHIGCFSLYVAKNLFFKNPKIYAIEPARSNFEMLKENVGLNHFNGLIRCFNFAIGAKDGIGFINSLAIGFDAFSVCNGAGLDSISNFEQCDVLALESFCAREKIQEIDLIKIDCEGCEHDVFKSSMDFFKERVKTIFIEVHSIGKSSFFEDFKSFLAQNNFAIEKEIMKRTLFVKNLNLC